MSFFLEIISSEEKVFSGQVDKLSVPAYKGRITVLSRHQPLFAVLKAGKTSYLPTGNKNKISFAINSGLVEVRKEKTILLFEPFYDLKKSSLQGQEAKNKSRQIKEQAKTKTFKLSTEDAFRRSFIDFKDIKKRKNIYRVNS